MNAPHVFPDPLEIAEAAVTASISVLRQSIDSHDVAVWVLAGGSTPMCAYELIGHKYLDALDWSKVTFLLGDERIGPLDGPDNNWQAIETVFLQHIPQATFIRPISDQTAEEAADTYEKHMLILPQVQPGIPRLDLVWLGMGEDGHTLSLFPDEPLLAASHRLVVPVHNSPKPPADRISLTLRALLGAEHTFILTHGPGKADALADVFLAEAELPIAKAAAATQAEWFIDTQAAVSLSSSAHTSSPPR